MEENSDGISLMSSSSLIEEPMSFMRSSSCVDDLKGNLSPRCDTEPRSPVPALIHLTTMGTIGCIESWFSGHQDRDTGQQNAMQGGFQQDVVSDTQSAEETIPPSTFPTNMMMGLEKSPANNQNEFETIKLGTINKPKVVVIGDCTGKSFLLNRFMRNKQTEFDMSFAGKTTFGPGLKESMLAQPLSELQKEEFTDQKTKNILLLGHTGAGKTTTLNHLGIESDTYWAAQVQDQESSSNQFDWLKLSRLIDTPGCSEQNNSPDQIKEDTVNDANSKCPAYLECVMESVPQFLIQFKLLLLFFGIWMKMRKHDHDHDQQAFPQAEGVQEKSGKKFQSESTCQNKDSLRNGNLQMSGKTGTGPCLKHGRQKKSETLESDGELRSSSWKDREEMFKINKNLCVYDFYKIAILL